MPPVSTRSAPTPSRWPATRITEVEPTISATTSGVAEGDRLVTHYFECHLAGYQGWRWAVTVTRVPRSRHVTVCETVLLPGPDALLAPGWLPWQERLQPGDLGAGDLLPTSPDDDRLAPGYVLSDDPAVEEIAWELGLGRARVISREGRAETAQRWYDGDHGPARADLHAAPRQRPLRHLRLLPAAGRRAAAGLRRRAATSTPRTTAGWSAPTTAAARTPRR